MAKNGDDTTSVTMELDILDCSVCWEPLRPPVFQCAVGHLICSTCFDKLRKRKKCHYCSRNGDYNRSYATEKILESMKVPCSNTKYGCDVKKSYHEKEELQEHMATCSHAPCFCPETGCGFTGSAGMLLAHFTTEHRWPFTVFRYGYSLCPEVREGVHVLYAEDGYLFLLNMAAGPLGCVVVTVFCVRHPRVDIEPKFRCAVTFFTDLENNQSHTQSSEFQVPSTTLADGIPRDSSMFVLVPKFYLDKESKIRITMY